MAALLLILATVPALGPAGLRATLAHASHSSRDASPYGVAVPTGLHVAGNILVNGSNQPIRLLGVNHPGSEYACVQGWGIFDGPTNSAAVAAVAAWHATAVRIPLNEDCWLGINGVPASVSGAAYQQAIAAYVNTLTSAGLVAILDLHWNAAGSAQATSQQPMADRDHAPAFWASVAATFKGNNSVVFDLYNEPHDISWACWRDGGTCAGVLYQVAGMQELVDAVRGAGAANVVLAGGLAWSNDLSNWLAYAPHDPTGNLAAAWHAYNFNACNTPSCYDAQVAPVAARVPVVVGEFAENDEGTSFITPLLSWLDMHGASYCAWAWTSWGDWQSLVSSFDGTPTSWFGAPYRAHLLAVAPTSAPAPPSATPTSPPALPSATPTSTPSPPALPSATPTSTPSPPALPSATPTSTPSPPSATPTSTPAPPSATPTSTPAPPSATPTSTPSPPALPSATPTLQFSTSFEGGQQQPTWANTVDYNGWGGGLSNVGGICCGLTGPETGMRQERARTGTIALMYSGNDTGQSASFAYAKVFDVSTRNIVIGPATTLSYWIYPQSGVTSPVPVYGSNSTCVAIDMIFGDGSDLRDSGVTDQNGVRLHPAAQCGHLTLNAWNHVVAALGPRLAGKTIGRIDVGYDQPANTGGYRGYIDDVTISN